MTRRLTIQSNILLAMLVVGSGSAALVGYHGYSHGEQALTEQVFNHLTSIRAARAYQIESYFQVIDSQARTWSQDIMLVDAMREFRASFHELQDESTDKFDQDLEELYEPFVESLDQRTKGRPQVETYLPDGAAAKYLQYHYLAANPHATGKRDKWDRAEDESSYSAAHERYHPLLRDLIEEFSYYDLFLIDIETGDIVYSVFKETDFATNLDTGPYRDTNLSVLLERVRENRDRGATQIVDFEPYRPSLLSPASFIACPIFDQAECIGVLALQMPSDQINRVMTGDRQWQRQGLGETGETYLVGPDHLLRSESRFWLEDQDAYLDTMRSTGSNEQQIDDIANYSTTVLQMSVETHASQEAQRGNVGVEIVSDYRDVQVLSSYAPLDLPGLDWVILAEMDLEEANAPAMAFTQTLATSMVAVILSATVISLLFSVVFTRPIRQLAALATRISEGESARFPEEQMNPEFCSLGQALNRTLTWFNAESGNLAIRAERADGTLRQLLPEPIAVRLKNDDWPIFEDASNVSILVARLTGTEQLIGPGCTDVAEGATLLDSLMQQFDVALAQEHVEKILGRTDLFVASSSLFETRIDPARRLLELAAAMQLRLRRFNLANSQDLGLQIGVHCGRAVVGIIGRECCSYSVWGEAYDIARELADSASDGQVLATEFIYENVDHLFRFEPLGSRTFRGESMAIHRLTGEAGPVSSSDDEVSEEV